MQLKMHEESILEVLFVSQNRGLERAAADKSPSRLALRQDQLHLSPSHRCLLNLSVVVSSEKFCNFPDICSGEKVFFNV